MAKKQQNFRLSEETIFKVRNSGIPYETLIKYGLAYFSDVKQQNLNDVQTNKEFSKVNRRVDILLNKISEIEIKLKTTNEVK